MNNGSVKGFLRHRYTRQVKEDGVFIEQYPPSRFRIQSISPLKARNDRMAEEAKKLYRRLKANGIATQLQPTYQHLHPTKGFRTRPA